MSDGTGQRRENRILAGRIRIDSDDERFVRLLSRALSLPPTRTSKIRHVVAISLTREREGNMVGLTKCSLATSPSGRTYPRQTITFYKELFEQLSDDAALGVIGHELAHAWLNEHVSPEESKEREVAADALAREWGFGHALDELDREAETV